MLMIIMKYNKHSNDKASLIVRYFIVYVKVLFYESNLNVPSQEHIREIWVPRVASFEKIRRF